MKLKQKIWRKQNKRTRRKTFRRKKIITNFVFLIQYLMRNDENEQNKQKPTKSEMRS